MFKQKKAFTLVELIVVITILAILGTIAFISLQGYSKDARDSTRISDIGVLKTGLEVFVTTIGIYPEPTGGVEITYSGAEVWTQGIVGESVISNLQGLSKKPLDPLTGNEYTYSRLNTKKEYELGGIIEGDIAYNPIISQVNAADNVVSYVKGTYNGVVAKVNTGSIDYVLAVPSIITSDITEVDIQNILQNQKLVFNGYDNIPSSYQGYTQTGGFDYDPSDIVVFEGSISDLSASGTLLKAFAENLQTAYSGTTIGNTSVYADISNMDTTSTTEVTLLAGNIVNNNLGGSVDTNVTTDNNVIETTCSNVVDGLIGLYHFDNDWNDFSGFDNHGSPINGVQFNSIGKIGNAGSFDGIDDYINLGSNNYQLLNDFTISAWVNINSSSPEVQTIFSTWGGRTMTFLQNDNKLGAQFLDPTITVYYSYDNSAIVLNNWYNITYVKNSSVGTLLYINGILVDSSTNISNVTYVSGETHVGGYPYTGHAEFLSGLIDDLAIYNRVLTLSEIQDIYNGGLAGKAICNP